VILLSWLESDKFDDWSGNPKADCSSDWAGLVFGPTEIISQHILAKDVTYFMQLYTFLQTAEVYYQPKQKDSAHRCFHSPQRRQMRAFAIEVVSHKVVRLIKCNTHTHQQNQFSNSTEVDIVQTSHYKRRGNVCLPAGALTKSRGRRERWHPTHKFLSCIHHWLSGSQVRSWKETQPELAKLVLHKPHKTHW